MDIKWLEDFVCLARTGNFSRAAEERHVTQPAFSRRIKGLELWVGSPLVDRSTYPMRLTNQGQDFLIVANNILESLYGAKAMVRESTARTVRTVVFSTQHTLALYLFPKWWQRLEKACGPMDVRMMAENLHNCVQALTEGACDMMICFTHPEVPVHVDSKAFDQKILGQDKLIPVTAPDREGRPLHSLPGEEGMPVSYLAYGLGSFLGRIVNVIRQRAAVPHYLSPRYENSFAEAIKVMVLEGAGIAWLPVSTIKVELDEGWLVNAGDEEWEEELAIHLYRVHGENRGLINRIWEIAAL